MLERWLTGWSMARGAPLPRHEGGGLVVNVGTVDEVRRHVFVDAGRALQACAGAIGEPFIYLKVTVEPEQLRRALSWRWQIEPVRYLMRLTAPMAAATAVPPGFSLQREVAHLAQVVRLVDASGQTAASGCMVMHQATAVFDRIETHAAFRRLGLGSAVMSALEQLAQAARARERLLVATEAGRSLYASLGWEVVAPYSTAVSPPKRSSRRLKYRPISSSSSPTFQSFWRSAGRARSR